MIAFVLGGGGHMGAYEVGMLRALLERGVRPGLIVGTSVGALNGAAVAAEPTLGMVDRLRSVWLGADQEKIFGGSLLAGALNMFRSRTYLHSNQPLADLITGMVKAGTFEELVIPFQCVAASVERAAEVWFSEGPLVEAILASAAVPGVLPAVEINGEHFLDGGVVNSIPISRAVELGAKTIFVLQVGRAEASLTVPKTPVQVATVTFEIARRHRFNRDLASLPEGVTAHLLPTGESPQQGLRQYNYRNFKAIARRIDNAYEASAKYLAEMAI